MSDAIERARELLDKSAWEVDSKRVAALAAALDYIVVLEKCMGNVLFAETRERFEKAQREFEDAICGDK